MKIGILFVAAFSACRRAGASFYMASKTKMKYIVNRGII